MRLPQDVLAELSASAAESQAVNRLEDRRLLFECAVTHYAAVNASTEQLDELERLTRDMAEATDWSYYHQADKRFHQLVGTASGMGTAVEVYHETLAELYDYFIPYSIEKLHKSNHDHVALVAALRAGNAQEGSRGGRPEARRHPAPYDVHGAGAGRSLSRHVRLTHLLPVLDYCRVGSRLQPISFRWGLLPRRLVPHS